MLTSTSGQYTTSYSYDARGNVASITYPGGGVETFVYNAANNVVSSTDRKGVTTTYTYNYMGKPVSISAGGKTKSYTYASTGNVLTETSEAGTTSYTYDYMGRVVSETFGSATTSYTYDRASNILTVTANGTTTSYTYDNLNRLTKTVNGSNIVDYVYDTAGRRTSTTVSGANGIVSKTSYTYDVAGNITALRNRKADDTLLSEFIYTYDAEGNVLSEYDSTTGKTTSYTYDILGRLVSEIGGGTSRYYTYDAAGNRIKAIVDTANTIQYTYDSDGRLTSETSIIGQLSMVVTYSYDANGNLIEKDKGVRSIAYAFDVWGNMVSADGASYTYNAQGLRTSKTVRNKTTNFKVVNGKVWSDGTYNYVWGKELITNGSVYYLYNAHGDVVQLLNSSGTVTKTYDYEAYGNELKRDAGDSNPFRYCGEYYDNETGFIYLRARYYDPSVGRFISQDPAKDGLNWYVYCDGNPVNRIDYNGCFWIELAALVGYTAYLLYASSAVYSNEMNRKADESAVLPKDKLIMMQDSYQYRDYRYGFSTIERSGCEVIAIHNAKILKNIPSTLSGTCMDTQLSFSMNLFGFGGMLPQSIGRILRDYDMEYTKVTLDEVSQPGVYIISYWTDYDGKLLKKQIHTVCIEFDGQNYITYNNGKHMDPTPPQEYAKDYICGYYLG